MRRIILTDGVCLVVVVCLDGLEVGADELEVDLVLDVGEQDECGDDAVAARGLHPGLDVAVPHVDGGGQDGAGLVGGHCQEDVVLVDEGVAGRDPVGLGRVAEVLLDGLDAVKRVHGQGAGLADGLGDTAIEAEGEARVAAAEAVCANSTLAIFCRPRWGSCVS